MGNYIGEVNFELTDNTDSSRHEGWLDSFVASILILLTGHWHFPSNSAQSISFPIGIYLGLPNYQIFYPLWKLIYLLFTTE